MAIEKYFIEQGDVAASEDLSDVVLSGAVQNEVLVRDGSNQWVNQFIAAPSLGTDSVITVKIQNSAVTLLKQADMVQERLIGRGGASGTGPPELLTIGSGLTLTGTELVATGGSGGDTITVNGSATAATDVDLDDTTPAPPAGGLNILWAKDALDPTNVSGHIAAGTVTSALLRDSAGFSVMGKSTTGSGSPADIVAGSDNTVFLREGGSLTFNTIVDAHIDPSAGIAITKLASFADVGRLLGSSSGTNDPIEIVADGVGDTVIEGDVLNISPAAVTFAKMQNILTDSLIGRGTAATGVPENITLGAGMVMTGTVLSSTGGSSPVTDILQDGGVDTITTSSSTFVDMTNMDVTTGFALNYLITASCTIQTDDSTSTIEIIISVNGVDVANSLRIQQASSAQLDNNDWVMSTNAVAFVAVSDIIKLRWRIVAGGQATAKGRSISCLGVG